MDCRWEADYESCFLDDTPHKRLTLPAKVFEYSFDGPRKARGREHAVKLELVQPGCLNAIVFWFDLHLDEQETITTGALRQQFLLSSVTLNLIVLLR